MKKKLVSDAEKAWRKAFSDERWERRADRLMWFFSAPSGLLPLRTDAQRKALRREKQKAAV